MERLEGLSEEERDRLRRIPEFTREERLKIRREILSGASKFSAVPNPDYPGYGLGLEGWECEAVEHLSHEEADRYFFRRHQILEIGPGMRFHRWVPPEDREAEAAFVGGGRWRRERKAAP